MTKCSIFVGQWLIIRTFKEIYQDTADTKLNLVDAYIKGNFQHNNTIKLNNINWFLSETC